MNLIKFAALGALFLSTLAGAQQTLPGGQYGDITLTKPVGDMHGFVVLFSDRAWTSADTDTAAALSKNGAMVVGVDTARYAQKLSARKLSCNNLAGDAEAMSHQLEREIHSSRYFAPILIGTGEGAAVAEKALRQAPDNTLAGAVSMQVAGSDGKAAPIDARFNPCPPDPTITHAKGLPGFYETGVLKPGVPAADSIVALAGPHLRPTVAADDDVTDLPLVELPSAHPSDMLAIVISGDGGWRDLDKTIGESLQKDGVSVIGIDSLRYFWSARTPAQTSDDLARVIRAYSARWHAKHVALIGYSFGADVMPFAYNRLPPDVRAEVSFVSLLGFSPNADFQIRVTGWLGLPASSDAMKVRPELAKIPPAMVQCVYGEAEHDTLCPELTHTGIDIIKMSGDHHFGGDYAVLARRILTGWQKHIGA